MTAIHHVDFGDDAIQLQTSAGPAWVVSSVERIPAALRGAAFASRCKDFRYYEVQEASVRDQFDYRYFVLHDEASGQWAIQPLFFVQQDLLAGLPQGLRSVFGGIRKVWPGFLKLPMMMIGCATGEGELDHDQPWVAQALHETVEVYRRQAKAWIILLKDFPASYRPSLAPFANNGFQRAPSMPAAELELDFATFEEYLAERPGKNVRKNLRRKLRAGANAPLSDHEMEVLTDASAIAGEIYPLYLQTHERSDFNFGETFTEDYFRGSAKTCPTGLGSLSGASMGGSSPSLLCPPPLTAFSMISTWGWITQWRWIFPSTSSRGATSLNGPCKMASSPTTPGP